jgi:hypothetical protein
MKGNRAWVSSRQNIKTEAKKETKLFLVKATYAMV